MTNKAQFIKDGWDDYHTILPKDASEIQIKETRHAFFAGAMILWHTILVTLDPGAEPTDQDMQRMDDIQAEFDAFGQELKQDLRNTKP